jgi:hypothetical protein
MQTSLNGGKTVTCLYYGYIESISVSYTPKREAVTKAHTASLGKS